MNEDQSAQSEPQNSEFRGGGGGTSKGLWNAQWDRRKPRWLSVLEARSRKRQKSNPYMLLCDQSISRVQLFGPHGLQHTGSSVHGIFQARILEGIAISCSIDAAERPVKQRNKRPLDLTMWINESRCTGMTQRDGTGKEEGSGWGTRVYLWWMHVDIWQNQYSIVKLKK